MTSAKGRLYHFVTGIYNLVVRIETGKLALYSHTHTTHATYTSGRQKYAHERE